MKKIGLIAGNGKLPFLFAQAARCQNIRVFAVGIKKDTNPFLRFFVEDLKMIRLNDYLKMFEIFKNAGVQKIVMAGQITPRRLFSKEITDPSLKKFLDSLSDHRADTIFGAIGKELSRHEFELLDSTELLKGFLATKGILTKTQPSPENRDDIIFGFQIAKAIAGVDIGQTIVVKDRSIVAVEAVEGTDATILRAGKIAGPGIVVVKVAKPKQDKRFDMPVVGPRTLKNMIKVRASCLAIEAGRTLMIDKVACVKLADRSSISIVSCSAQEIP